MPAPASMNNELYDRVATVFQRACELEGEDRECWITESCDGEPELLANVRALLKSDVPEDDFLEAAGRDASALLAEEDIDALPERIGPYRILRRLGEGGMGVVYEAEQESPRRRVALKLVRPGMTTPRLLRRFEFETEVLGRLEHAGIASIFEAGTAETPLGELPFFAMELVHGKPIHRWADDSGLLPRQRVELLVQVCDAVEHAHAKGVIHRDLKPGNVLVDESGAPRVLDFGVARLAGEEREMHDRMTREGQLVGTPAYSSPEQVRGDPGAIDARTDVYSLGVLGYELLAGRLPHALEGKSLTEAARIIEQEEPRALSADDPRLRGDLETIFAKALEKDPERRYVSASALAADLRRYLNDEPIEARPATVAYQLRKFARRNPWLVAGAASTLLALVIGLVATLVFAFKARDEARMARAAEQREADEREIAEAIRDFLHEDVLAAAAPSTDAGRGRDATLFDTLKIAAMTLATASKGDGRLADKPLVVAALHATIGESFFELGEHDRAWNHLSSAAELFRRERGPDHEDALTAEVGLVSVTTERGEYEAGEERARELLRRVRSKHGAATRLAYRLEGMLGRLQINLGRGEESIERLRNGLEGLERIVGPLHPETMTAMHNCASALYTAGKLEDGERLFHEALERRMRALGEDHPSTLATRHALAVLAINAGRPGDAIVQLRTIVEGNQRVLGPDHAKTIEAQLTLGDALTRAGELDEAQVVLLATADDHRRVLGERHRETLHARRTLAWLRHRQGRLEEAVLEYEAILPICEEVMGPDHDDTARICSELGWTLTKHGEVDRAIPFLERTRKLYEARFPADHPEVATTAYKLGVTYVQAGRFAEAEPLLRATLENDSATYGPHHPFTHQSQFGLARALVELGRPGEGRELIEDILAHGDPLDPREASLLEDADDLLEGLR